ncbi:MAG: polysaccharide deacetylase family protein [Hyphomicrobiales bacterium]
MRFTVALFVCTLAGVSVQASAETCSANPDALGTSRVLTINPGEFIRLGTLQYKQTLPLKDHEVVLTFDDGPLPPYTESTLDTLASQCVKATYFLVGQMAHAYPSVVRRIYNEGHTIGTHSQDHPRAFERLSRQGVEREVDGGINSVTAALGDAKALSPFFRLPGFGRTNAIERFLESKQLVTWSADVDTDDWWRGSTPAAIVKRAMRRLNAKGRGIILLHDIHQATAMALPILLKELKANGYAVVHVVAAGERPKSLPELMALPTTDGRISPTGLTSAPSGDHALTARQNRRIKKHNIIQRNRSQRST